MYIEAIVVSYGMFISAILFWEIFLTFFLLVLELSHKVLFDVDNGTMTVNDALGVAAAQKISYDLSDPAIYSNKSLHISLTDVDGMFTWHFLIFDIQ